MLDCYIINNNRQIISNKALIFKTQIFNIEKLKNDISNNFYIPKEAIIKLYYFFTL